MCFFSMFEEYLNCLHLDLGGQRGAHIFWNKTKAKKMEVFEKETKHQMDVLIGYAIEIVHIDFPGCWWIWDFLAV